MKVPGESRGIGASLVQILERSPVLSSYVKTRGWPYVLSWMHRLTGIGLIIILMVHTITLSSLQTPYIFNAKMKTVASTICLFLAWTWDFMPSTAAASSFMNYSEGETMQR
jgi:succinate dehydrogenase/fumarate reductase cytochrome b subunit